MVFVADSSVRSLNSLTTNYRGRDGEHGRSSYHAGKGGANVMIKVTQTSCYTIVYTSFQIEVLVITV